MLFCCSAAVDELASVASEEEIRPVRSKRRPHKPNYYLTIDGEDDSSSEAVLSEQSVRCLRSRDSSSVKTRRHQPTHTCDDEDSNHDDIVSAAFCFVHVRK